jgi:hypothetical protein
MDNKIALNSGKLRSAEYLSATRSLLVELENGVVLEYLGVGDSIWQRLASSGNAWSYYRDNIEDEFTARQLARKPGSGTKKNPLDDLFGE